LAFAGFGRRDVRYTPQVKIKDPTFLKAFCGLAMKQLPAFVVDTDEVCLKFILLPLNFYTASYCRVPESWRKS
jgi:hypothetical protein